MKREDLKDLELSKEAIDKIMELHGKDIEATKSKVEEKIKSDYDRKLEDLNSTIQYLKD